jgi:hypothetical protein
MIRLILNKVLRAKGSYWVEDTKIYRSLPFGLNYVCQKCNSSEEAKRIAFQLTQLSLK